MTLSQALRSVAKELRSEFHLRDRAMLPADVAQVLDRVANRIDGDNPRPTVPYNPDAYLEIQHA